MRSADTLTGEEADYVRNRATLDHDRRRDARDRERRLGDELPELRPRPRPSRARRAPGHDVEVRDVNLFYGDFHAVEGVNMTIQPNKVTALIGSSGCGKTTFLRSLNRMHELTPGARAEGWSARRRGHLRPGSTRSRCAADRHGLPAAEPVPDDVDLRERRRRPQPQLEGIKKSERTRSSSARCAAPTSGTRSRTGSTSPAPASPAASSSGSASPARSRSSPRCC